MPDRRKFERFNLTLRSSIFLNQDSSAAPGLSLFTRDISPAGAYFPTTNPLPPATRIRAEIFIPVCCIDQPGSQDSILISSGTVVRQEGSGMAVNFDESQLFPRLK